jgi:hypothetical protein
MLKHYLEQISALEFSERNAEIPGLVTQKKSAMNSRSVLNSTMTLQALAEFFAAEFLARCDFLKIFVISHPGLLDPGNEADIVTKAKTLFQNSSFIERDGIKSLYNSTIKSISESLANEGMKSQIESSFVKKMEERITKNNLYVELAYHEIVAANRTKKNLVMLQPNLNGVGIDLIELWNRYIK